MSENRNPRRDWKLLKLTAIPFRILTLMVAVADSYMGGEPKKPAVGFHIQKMLIPPPSRISFGIIAYEYPDSKAAFPKYHNVTEVIREFRNANICCHVPGMKEVGPSYMSIDGNVSRYTVDVSFEAAKEYEWPPVIFDTWSRQWTERVASPDDLNHGIVDYRLVKR